MRLVLTEHPLVVVTPGRCGDGKEAAANAFLCTARRSYMHHELPKDTIEPLPLAPMQTTETVSKLRTSRSDLGEGGVRTDHPRDFGCSVAEREKIDVNPPTWHRQNGSLDEQLLCSYLLKWFLEFFGQGISMKTHDTGAQP